MEKEKNMQRGDGTTGRMDNWATRWLGDGVTGRRGMVIEGQAHMNVGLEESGQRGYREALKLEKDTFHLFDC